MSTTKRKKLDKPNGLELSKLEFNFIKSGDFLFWEGPLMSHFINNRNEDFIFKWSAKDDIFNRWLVYKSTPALLLDYLDGKINSADLILKNPDGFVYFIDMDDDLIYRNIYLVKIQDIPKNYMPLQDSFYEIDTYEPYTQKLHTQLNEHFSRQKKLYKSSEWPADIAAEPPTSIYQKKKK